MKQQLRFGLVAILGVVAGLGCSTPVRVVTNGYWVDTNSSSRLYLSYWEGQCMPVMGCSSGAGHVKVCSAGSDNETSCKDQPGVDALLAN